jgi:hypothetical protein
MGLSPAVQIAALAKLILCRRSTGLTLWKIKNNTSPIQVEDAQHHTDDWDRILEIELTVKTTLLASAISGDGVWIAAADRQETKLFRLVQEKVCCLASYLFGEKINVKNLVWSPTKTGSVAREVCCVRFGCNVAATDQSSHQASRGRMHGICSNPCTRPFRR